LLVRAEIMNERCVSLENLKMAFIWEIRTLILAGKRKLFASCEDVVIKKKITVLAFPF
jgi:hypothetical protein